MKMDRTSIQLECIKNELLRSIPKRSRSKYFKGYKLFITSFFFSASILDKFKEAEISTDTCTQVAMDEVKIFAVDLKIEDQKLFYQGSMDACQKTFQFLE